MDINDSIINEVSKIETDIIKWRRYLHKNPEIGFALEKTSAFVREKLKEWGYQIREMAQTGVVATIKGGREASGDIKTVAIRADMDALPLAEKSGVDYSSENPGKMHACGHDAHTAIALGAARVLSILQPEIAGNVRFIFQPAEEGPGGAAPMIKEGALENPAVDRIIGLHLRTDIPSGQIGIGRGPIMAATDQFTLKVKGTGAHGAHPDEGVDPIVISSQIILALQTLVSRETKPTDSLVITTGSIDGGTAYNIIPDEVKLKGTVRTLDSEIRKNVRERMEAVIEGITSGMRADYQFDYKFDYPVTVNDPKVTALMEEVVEDMLGKEGVYDFSTPSMGGEDFAYFLREIPGSYVFLGIYNPEIGAVHPGHSPKFKIDESVLKLGTEYFCRGVFKLLAK